MTPAWGKSWGVAWGASWGYAEQSARSGYWRLFYTQMQEEALKKDGEGTKTEESKSIQDEQRPDKRARVEVVRKRKTLVRKKVAPPRDPQKDAVSRPVVPLLRPTVVEPTIYEILNSLPRFDLSEVKIDFSKIIQLDAERQRRKKRRQEEELILLMAA